jgi:hypothetical protein
MTQSRMRLDQVSKQLGFNTRASRKTEDSPIDNSGSLNDHDNPEESEILNARIIDQEEDSQPVEKKPGLRMALMTGLLASTIGVGITVTLWNGSNSKTADAQKAKGTGPVANENADKDKEVSDLKAEVAIQKQKEDAAKLAASRTKTASSSASPSPSASVTASVSPSPRPTTTVQANASTNNQAAVQPSRPQRVAKVASSSRANDQDNGQLAALRSAVQREKNTLAGLRKQQTTTQTAKPTRTQSVQPTEVAKQTSRQSSTNSSWEDVAASGNYGGTAATSSPSSTGTNTASASTDQIASADDRGGAMSPQLRLPVGESVSAKLVTPFYTLIKNTGFSQASQSTDKNFASIVTEKPIDMGSGWRIPAKSVIEFSMQVADNGLIQAVSKRVISGNVVIPVPQGAFTLTSEDSQPLQAEIKIVNGDQLARSDIMTTIWGAAGEVGKSLAESGNQSTVAVGANTVISNVNNQVSGNNILGSVLKGGANQIIQQSTDRNKSQAQQLEKQSKVAFLNPGTKARVFVSQSVAFQVPLEGAAQAGLIDPRATQISRADVPATAENSLAPIVSNSSSAADTPAPPPSPPTAAETDPDMAAKTGAKVVTKDIPEVKTAPASSEATPNVPRSIID